MLRCIAIILITSTVIGVPQQPGAPDEARRQDIYAVYSALFAKPDANNPVYLIHAKASDLRRTVDLGFGPQRCVTVPTAYATDWNEVLAEFMEHKDSPGTIEQMLRIETPYLLLKENVPLKENEVQQTRNSKGTFRLGNVYFNQRRSLALTYRSASCGWLCGEGRWVVLEKDSASQWQLRPEWVHCFAIA